VQRPDPIEDVRRDRDFNPTPLLYWFQGTSKETAMAEKPSATLPGTVEKIIKSPFPGEPERAEISVIGADYLYKEIRIENTLVDGNGEPVRLKVGAPVEVKVQAEASATTCDNYRGCLRS
jgi:hypothetical protein